MQNNTAQKYEDLNEVPVPMNNIIYLYDYTHKKLDGRPRVEKADILWNVLFVCLCLSALVVLFLH